jgi:hypothetical protein
MMRHESGSSAESGCSRSDGPTDVEAERSRSAIREELINWLRRWALEISRHPASSEWDKGFDCGYDAAEEKVKEFFDQTKAKTGG